MTTAEELRTAAATLRARLADPELTPGPWLSLDHGDRILYDGPGADDQPPVYVIDEPMSNGANADYLELLHPGVGAALADWLEYHAATSALLHAIVDGPTPERDRYALAVARAINGRPR